MDPLAAGKALNGSRTGFSMYPPALRGGLVMICLLCAQVLFLVLPGRPIAAGPAPLAPSSGPPARLVSDGEGFEVGTIDQGQTAHHTFTIRNLGPGPARIERTWTSCGCTATQLSMQEVAAGSEVPLEVTFKAGGGGDFQKWVFVYSNDPQSPLKLWVKGTTRPVCRLEPDAVDFGRMAPGQEVRRSVVLRPVLPGAALQPARPTSPLPAVRVFEPVSLGDGTFRVDLVAHPTAPGQPLNGILTIPTGNATAPTLMLRVAGQVAQ